MVLSSRVRVTIILLFLHLRFLVLVIGDDRAVLCAAVRGDDSFWIGTNWRKKCEDGVSLDNSWTGVSFYSDGSDDIRSIRLITSTGLLESMSATLPLAGRA